MSTNMTISDRDKQLIYFIAALGIVFAAWFFGYRNFMTQRDTYKQQAQQYRDEYATLIEHQRNREQYIAMTNQYKLDREELLTHYEDGYNQENMIKTISDIETEVELWIPNVTFQPELPVYTFTTEEGKVGVCNATEIVFQESSYESFKNFLAEILAIDSKTKIVEFTVSYDETTQLCQGNMTIEHYSIYGVDSEGPKVVIDLPVGVENIFDSAAVTSNSHTTGANGSYILTDYDACVLINPNESTIDSVIVGTTNDSKAKDSLSYDKNDTVELTITVDGKDGKYTISYKLDDDTYPSKNYEKGVSFEPGDTLDLLVQSSVRDGNKDKVAVEATLINNSDMELNVLVAGDDTVSPRFEAVKREGEITIYR